MTATRKILSTYSLVLAACIVFGILVSSYFWSGMTLIKEFQKTYTVQPIDTGKDLPQFDLKSVQGINIGGVILK